jgi:RluA family pseudouridine synthase
MSEAALRILFRDALVLAIDKPAGALSVPGRVASDRLALSQQVQALAPEALPVHRLDRDTSGVLLFALGRKAHRALNSSFESRQAEKRYLALCSGQLKSGGRCALPLHAARAGGMRVARPDEGGALAAVTEVSALETFAAASLLEARPRTGRTHQIRVHLAALGVPLLLDPRYGQPEPLAARALDPLAPEGDAIVLTRTPLHAAAIRVPHPSGRGYLQIESPTPPDFARCLELLRAARRRG